MNFAPGIKVTGVKYSPEAQAVLDELSKARQKGYISDYELNNKMRRLAFTEQMK
jgi:hypothetical protein